jgi:hypothetical protein
LSKTEQLSSKIDSLSKIIINQNNDIIKVHDELENYKNDVKNKIDFQNQTLTLSTNSVSTSLTSLDNYLNLWGIIFAIFGVLIGAYIVWAQNKMSNILTKANTVLSQQREIQKEVNETQNLIEKDLSGLYKKLQDKEVKHMIQRLINNSEDLCNLFSPLTSKNIPEKYFEDLKKVALKCYKNDYPNRFGEIENISTLLFQHFPDSSYYDDDLGESLRKKSLVILNNSFPNEVINSTGKIVSFAANRNIQSHSETLKTYFEYLQKSDHNSNVNIYSKAYQSCLNKKNKFTLFKVMLDSKVATNFLKYYGDLLVSEFDKDENTESEKAILKTIKEKK